MSAQVAETLLALAIYNSWRRGDETIEMPSPAEIGATIDDAVNLLRKYDDLKVRAERAEAELATERARLRQLALDACRAAAIVPLVWYPTGYYVNPNDLGKINKQQVDACVAAIDAAMKEGA